MKTYFKTSLAGCLTATLLFCVTSLADASLVVNVNGNAPTLDYIYKYRELNSGETADSIAASKYTSGSSRTIGQQFNTTGESNRLAISAVTFSISSFSTDVLGKQFSLSIYQASSLTTKPSAAERIFYDTGTLPLELTAGEYITFTLSSSQELAPGMYYTVVFDFLDTTGTSGALYFKTVGTGNSNAPLNRVWAATNTSDWGYTSATNGLIAYIHATPVPEPAISALLIGALVSGCGYQLLRKK